MSIGREFDRPVSHEIEARPPYRAAPAQCAKHICDHAALHRRGGLELRALAEDSANRLTMPMGAQTISKPMRTAE